MKTIWQFLNKLNMELAHDSAILLLWESLMGMRKSLQAKNFTVAKDKNNLMSINWRMDKQNAVCKRKALSFSHAQEWSADRPQHRWRILSQWKQPDKRQHLAKFHLYEVSRIGKSTKRDNRSAVSMSWEESKDRDDYLLDARVTFRAVNNFWVKQPWWLHNTVSMLMPLYAWAKMVKVMICVLKFLKWVCQWG